MRPTRDVLELVAIRIPGMQGQEDGSMQPVPPLNPYG